MPLGIAGSRSRRGARLGAASCCAALALLAACAGPGSEGGGYAARHHRYKPPGPPEDPWGPYIREAALRYGVPEQWVRAVMRQESGGRDDATSSAGAMGLMQVMPATYAMLRARYGLGDDPYEPHDNIMAGTAYIRELYDKYGAPGFLAAYNAGPRRLDSYLADGTPLPEETVGYLSNIAPRLGADRPLSGPLAVFAGNDAAAQPTPAYAPAPPQVTAVARSTGYCDPDAAFDPDHPCSPALAPAAPMQVASASPPAPAALPPPAATAYAAPPPPPSYTPPAYVPPSYAAPQGYAPAAPVQAAFSPPPQRAVLPPLVYSPAPPASPVQLASLRAPGGGWAIQVGAFLTPDVARAAAEEVRRSAPDLLGSGSVQAPATTPFGGKVLYRARIVALSEASASAACARLAARGAACIAVPPGG